MHDNWLPRVYNRYTISRTCIELAHSAVIGDPMLTLTTMAFGYSHLARRVSTMYARNTCTV